MQSLEFLGFERYAVTSCGKVWSHTSNRFLTNYSNKKHHDKYYRVSLSNCDKKVKVSKVHRLVAYAFLEKPFGKDHVNHIDGDIYNNHVDNLEWCTPTENNTHSMENVRKGQFLEDQSMNITQNGKFGSRTAGRYKITEEEAHQYCKYMEQGYRACDIQVLMGINRKTFTRFKSATHPTYNHIAEQYDFSRIPTIKKLTQEQVLEICERLQNKETIMSIYRLLEVSRNAVQDIKLRKTYLAISKDYSW